MVKIRFSDLENYISREEPFECLVSNGSFKVRGFYKGKSFVIIANDIMLSSFDDKKKTIYNLNFYTHGVSRVQTFVCNRAYGYRVNMRDVKKLTGRGAHWLEVMEPYHPDAQAA